jgi:glycosyltransferase involved in cell wall biosynthesis
MRILLVSEDIPFPAMGGLAKHVLNLARALVRAGHHVDILGGDQHPIDVAGEEGKFGGRFFGELNGHDKGWKEKSLGMFLPPRRTWVARRFARIIMRHAYGYDVIHYHGHAPNVARYIPKHINFVQTRHDQGSECLADIRFRNGKICTDLTPKNCASCRTAQPNALQNAVSTIAVKRYRSEVAKGFLRHKTIFVSESLQRNFSRVMGQKAWGSIVHNFADGASIERARCAAGASVRGSTGTIKVFIAAKIYAAKGIEPFLHALHEKIPLNMHIQIVGDGPDAERLSNAFKHERISFLGWCTPEKTLEMAAASDIVVVPSVCEESCSTTVLEGLLLAKPTFALALGGTPELEMYAAYPGQLRLHADMHSLVQDLIHFKLATNPVATTKNTASADSAVSELIKIYAQPPGNNLNYGL